MAECEVTGEAPPVMAGRKRKANRTEEFVRRRNFVDFTAEKADSASSDEQNATRFSSNGSFEVDDDVTSKLVDLEKGETDELDSSTYKLEACTERRETTPLPTEVRAEMKSAPSPKATPPPSRGNPRRRLTADKSPTEAELEDFFAGANAQIQQQFAIKYNFDISAGKPLEGRFDWVRVEP